jgi:hypothetical protein
MGFSIHLPPDLIEWLDREAARRGITRNRLITTILAREMNTRDDWNGDLFARLLNSAMSEGDP